ncbi:MAG TPA: hypothetical protein VFN25_14990 [Dokdonella sp.]|uniref:hypothetical protein n=1 Tax=Dokdonella sp. TaxID=2291710 RepID=UPI002D7FBC0F|nr:hypothetical protein [Dokdonella sp.]HET9034197.1 hypothetical protein [Dokdonella sp.]
MIGLVLFALAAPVAAKSREKALTETLRTYAATIRWGSIEQAEAFVDPEYRLAHPLTQLELDRFKQVRITNYNDTAPVPVNDNEVRQTVEIGIVNVHTQEARSIIDRQVWKYDRKAKVWLLSSGLPDITHKD